jgi:hypothetical protein
MEKFNDHDARLISDIRSEFNKELTERGVPGDVLGCIVIFEHAVREVVLRRSSPKSGKSTKGENK